MNTTLVTDQEQRIIEDVQYMISQREIVLMEGQPLAGRTVIMEFEIGLMIVEKIDPDTEGEVLGDNNKQN